MAPGLPSSSPATGESERRVENNVGTGSTVKWPIGLGGKGNDGIAAFVQRLPGAIGYVEYAYAKQNNWRTPN